MKPRSFTVDIVARASEVCVGEYCLSKQEFRPPGACKRAGGCSSCGDLKDKDPSALLMRPVADESEEALQELVRDYVAGGLGRYTV